MNVLVNLLPDTRQAKLRERRRRQLFAGVAVVTWIICGGVIGLLVLYSTSQKLIIASLSNDIRVKKQQLQDVAGLTDALTAQQHLASLPRLYSQRAYLTKFFAAYSEVNPAEVLLSSLAIDASNQLTVNGTAKSYAAAAKLARALEAANVTVGKNAAAGNQPYFTNVEIQSANRSNDQVSFTLNAMLATGVTSGK